MKKGEVSGAAVFIGLLIILLFAFGVIYLTNFKGVKEKVDTKMEASKEKKQKSQFNPAILDADLGWCKVQSFRTGNGYDDPQSVRILGTDSIDLCCVKEFKGINNCLNKTQKVKICQTAEIGGEIMWVKVDDIYQEPELASKFIDNLDSAYNPSLFGSCDTTIY